MIVQDVNGTWSVVSMITARQAIEQGVTISGVNPAQLVEKGIKFYLQIVGNLMFPSDKTGIKREGTFNIGLSDDRSLRQKLRGADLAGSLRKQFGFYSRDRLEMVALNKQGTVTLWYLKTSPPENDWDLLDAVKGVSYHEPRPYVFSGTDPEELMVDPSAMISHMIDMHGPKDPNLQKIVTLLTEAGCPVVYGHLHDGKMQLVRYGLDDMVAMAEHVQNREYCLVLHGPSESMPKARKSMNAPVLVSCPVASTEEYDDLTCWAGFFAVIGNEQGKTRFRVSMAVQKNGTLKKLT